MKKGYSHITLILDRSGSMSANRNDVIGGVNEFIEAQKKVPGECTMTIVQFDSENPYETLRDFSPVATIVPMGQEYRPRGNTPLYDAIGKGIVSLGEKLANMPESDRPENVIFATMTDGEENSSKEYSRDRVAAMTKEQAEKYGWKFVYLGANQDAMAVGASIGTQAASTSNYAPQNTLRAMGITGQNVAAFRASGDANALSYTDEQRNDLSGNP